MKKILFIFGTRPEVIKLAPLILELRKFPNHYQVFLCNTEQQKELSNQTLKYFGLQADFNLDVMKTNQSLQNLHALLLSKLNLIFEMQFDAVFAQGDTMTAFCAGLAAFYHTIPLFHIEAGLRSGNLREPFPEEAIRQMLSRIASFHFAPTQASAENLKRENIPASLIQITGNTVIDALHCLPDHVIAEAEKNLNQQGIFLDKPLVLVTAHRRENHGEPLEIILQAIKTLALKYPGHTFVIPVHPNPNVKYKFIQSLQSLPNIKLLAPLDYPELVCLLKHSSLILTDSGGIQEEAPSFGTPLLVLRNTTERQEGVDAGCAVLVGNHSAEKIINAAIAAIEHPVKKLIPNPYGDGKACTRIEKKLALLLS